MKVLHLETGMHLYGGAKQVSFILAGLQKLKVDNVLMCPIGSDIQRAAERAEIQVIPFHTTGGTGFSLFREIAQTLEAISPDLVHVHSRRLAVDFWAGLAAKKRGIPAVLSRRVDNPEPRWLVAMKYRYYNKVIAISEGIRQVLISEGLDSNQVVTVRSSIDVHAINTLCEPEKFRAEFGIPENSFTIAVLAQLIHRKGHRHLIEILPDVVRRHPNIKVLFFGKGRERENLSAEIAGAGLESSVQFVGFREDLPRWLPCIDLIVHPADMEGLGVSLLQAAACYRPIIAVRAGGMPEIVHDELNGLLMEPGDTATLLKHTLRLIANPAERKSFGEAGRNIVERDFSLETMVNGNLRCYKEILLTQARNS